MKNLKSLFLVAALVLVFSATASSAGARDIGVVDLNKVIDNYTEAQKVAADLKVKETELQNFIVNAQNKIKDAKTPLEKKNLEEKSAEEFNLKRSAYVKEQTEKWDAIENDILKAVEDLYNRKKLELVLNKQGVIVGGVDITDELIKNLNDKVKK